jgi:recombinational DNA repair protein RecR
MDQYPKNIKTIDELREFHDNYIIQLAFRLIRGCKPQPNELKKDVLKYKKSRNIKELILTIKFSQEIQPVDEFSKKTKEIFNMLKQITI